MKKIIFSIILGLSFFQVTLLMAQSSSFRFDCINNGNPFIELSYGRSQISLENSDYIFIPSGTINLKLGWSRKRKSYEDYIIKYKSRFIHGSFTSGRILTGNHDSDSPVTLSLGFGAASGYGYKVSKYFSLILYDANSFTWTRFGGTQADELDNSKLNDFTKTLRFGSSTEGGLIIPLGKLINLELSYERTLAFPRHLVWKHLGSAIIEYAGKSLIDKFVHEVFQSSPEAGPIVSFILKNGLSYGIYELRRENMNWPFKSAEPLLLDTYRAGVTFTF